MLDSELPPAAPVNLNRGVMSAPLEYTPEVTDYTNPESAYYQPGWSPELYAEQQAIYE